MTTTSSPKDIRHSRALTLLELLVGISVISTLSLITVSAVSPFVDRLEAANDRRNAQTLASAAAALTAEGDKALVGLATKAEALAYLSMVGQEGGGHGAFSVPSLSEEDLQGAARYLDFQNGFLCYTSEGVDAD